MTNVEAIEGKVFAIVRNRLNELHIMSCAYAKRSVHTHRDLMEAQIFMYLSYISNHLHTGENVSVGHITDNLNEKFITLSLFVPFRLPTQVATEIHTFYNSVEEFDFGVTSYLDSSTFTFFVKETDLEANVI